MSVVNNSKKANQNGANETVIYLGKSHQHHAYMILNSEQVARICGVQTFLEFLNSLCIHRSCCSHILILLGLCLSRKL